MPVSLQGKVRSLIFSFTLANLFVTQAHIPGLATLGDQITVKAIYSRSEKSSRDLAVFVKSTLGPTTPDPSVYHDSSDPQNSLDALLARSDIDAVIVILPITKQPEVVLKALAAGKHVLSEKPIAKDVATGIDLVRKYVSEYLPKGLVWRVAENYEYEPAYREAGQLVRGGQIGRVISFSATGFVPSSKGNKNYKTDWRTVPDVSQFRMPSHQHLTTHSVSQYQGGFLVGFRLPSGSISV